MHSQTQLHHMPTADDIPEARSCEAGARTLSWKAVWVGTLSLTGRPLSGASFARAVPGIRYRPGKNLNSCALL